MKYRAPTFVDTRGDAHLMIWGDLGVWLVMDDELASLVRGFDGRRSTHMVLNQHAAKWHKPFETVRKEASPILEALEERAVLHSADRPAAPAGEPLSIANITLNLTNRCNLKCPFCYNDSGRLTEAPIEQMIRFMENGRDAMDSDASLIILGGEPFLMPERLFPLLDRAGELFVRSPMISTNGTRLTKEVVERLKAARVEVQVSLDSADPAVHDRGRGKGVFQKAVEGIERLVNAGVYVIVSMVFHRDTINGMGAFLELAEQLNVNEARFIPLRNIGAAARNSQLTSPSILDAFETLTALLDRNPEYCRLLARDFFTIAAVQCSHSASRVSCGIGRRVIFIDADGTLYPCPNHVSPEYRLGHIRTDRLSSILRISENTRAIRRRYHVDNYRRCATCPFKRWCAGDCRGEVLATTGDPLAPSPNCGALKKMYLRMLWRLAASDPTLGRLSGVSAKDAALSTFLT